MSNDWKDVEDPSKPCSEDNGWCGMCGRCTAHYHHLQLCEEPEYEEEDY